MSNILGFRDPAVIEAQAREWLVRLDGDAPLSNEEQQSLREWLGRSPANRAELKRLAEFWSAANVLTRLSVPLHRPRHSLDLAGRWSASSVAARATIAVAIACVPIALAVWWWMSAQTIRNGAYATRIGEQKTLALADGSSVQINTNSQVQVEYGEHVRKVWLLRGEAYFNVAPDRQRPFEVLAAGGVVRAVGTAFLVHLEGAVVDVTVTSGQVNVVPDAPVGGVQSDDTAAPARTFLSLKAGQAATFSSMRSGAASLPGPPQQLSQTEIKRRTAWHEGYLVFSGQDLGEVIAEVNRYSPVSLELADPALARLSIGGRFKLGDLDAVCEVLQSTFGIEAVRIDDRHILLRPASAR